MAKKASVSSVSSVESSEASQGVTRRPSIPVIQFLKIYVQAVKDGLTNAEFAERHGLDKKSVQVKMTNLKTALIEGKLPLLKGKTEEEREKEFLTLFPPLKHSGRLSVDRTELAGFFDELRAEHGIAETPETPVVKTGKKK